jgi:imidazole glycerol-phosphate synthase subunit HisF
MLKRRFIPVLFLQDGWMVRSELFKTHQIIGSPAVHVERMVEWDVDELIVIDISSGGTTKFDHGRLDHRDRGGPANFNEFISFISSECRIPLAIGGRIRSLADITERIKRGADKVCVNHMILNDAPTVTEAAKQFGSQAIVASIDYRIIDGQAVVFTEHGTLNTGRPALDVARQARDMLSGEIFLNAIDRDGAARGYDIETINAVVEALDIPVIACGGAGHQRHFLQCFNDTNASAVAAGNIFHFTENSYPRFKNFLKSKECRLR